MPYYICKTTKLKTNCEFHAKLLVIPTGMLERRIFLLNFVKSNYFLLIS